ncbi:MAG: site-specific DNA-methyltransferase [Clostridia bacterium]|nr:site-specific DNA-methyltransferase [Clostridia bacterium]
MFERTEVSRLVIGSGRDELLCLDVSLPQDALAAHQGKAQFVYMDPPFLTGDTFALRRPFGTTGWEKGKPMVQTGGFSDRASDPEAYYAMLKGLITTARGLLRPEGLFALHLDWRASARARLLCEEIFGPNQFLNELIWSYESGGRAKRWFSRKHDTILLFAADAGRYRFSLDKVPIPRTEARHNHLKRRVDENGRAYGAITVGGKEYRYYDDEPTYPGDVWTDISHLQQRDPERTGWPTQKPLRLMERLMLPTVTTRDLAVELCCGSGSCLAAARALGCHFVGCDLAPEAISVSVHRLQKDLSVTCPQTADQAALYGGVHGGMMLLTGLDAPHPAWPRGCSGLDAIESWACGRLTPDGVLRAFELLRRTRSTPDIQPMSLLPPGPGVPAVWCFDAAGRAMAFRWTGEE